MLSTSRGEHAFNDLYFGFLPTCSMNSLQSRDKGTLQTALRELNQTIQTTYATTIQVDPFIDFMMRFVDDEDRKISESACNVLENLYYNLGGNTAIYMQHIINSTLQRHSKYSFAKNTFHILFQATSAMSVMNYSVRTVIKMDANATTSFLNIISEEITQSFLDPSILSHFSGLFDVSLQSNNPELIHAAQTCMQKVITKDPNTFREVSRKLRPQTFTDRPSVDNKPTRASSCVAKSAILAKAPPMIFGPANARKRHQFQRPIVTAGSDNHAFNLIMSHQKPNRYSFSNGLEFPFNFTSRTQPDNRTPLVDTKEQSRTATSQRVQIPVKISNGPAKEYTNDSNSEESMIEMEDQENEEEEIPINNINEVEPNSVFETHSEEEREEEQSVEEEEEENDIKEEEEEEEQSVEEEEKEIEEEEEKEIEEEVELANVRETKKEEEEEQDNEIIFINDAIEIHESEDNSLLNNRPSSQSSHLLVGLNRLIQNDYSNHSALSNHSYSSNSSYSDIELNEATLEAQIDTRTHFEKILESLTSSDWIEQNDAIQSLQQTTNDFVEPMNEHLRELVASILECASSTRSVLSKNAFVCLQQIFKTDGISIQLVSDFISSSLLELVASNKQFVSSLASESFAMLLESISAEKAEEILIRESERKRDKARAKVALAFSSLANRITEFSTSLHVLAHLASDPNPDVRRNAKNSITLIAAKCGNFQTIVYNCISEQCLRKALIEAIAD